jgi:hypothetical protein
VRKISHLVGPRQQTILLGDDLHTSPQEVIHRAVKKGPMNEDMPLVSMQTSDRLRTLERLWDRISREIDITGDKRSLCLLTTQPRGVLSEIAELAPPGQPSAVEEIARRRRERRKQGLSVGAYDNAVASRGARLHG